MATTVTGKLNKAATQFQAGDSTGFGVRLGVKYRDPKTKQDDWCNYSAVIFAKSPGQIQFYQDALIEGSVIEVSAEQLSIETFQGNNGPMNTINMLNARLGYVHTGQQAQPQQRQQGQSNNQGYQPSGQQQAQQRPQQSQQRPQQAQQSQAPMVEPNFDFDDAPF